MDPRKTVVIADFEEVMRGVRQANELGQLPAARLGEKTVAQTSGDEGRPPTEPAVVIGRTLLAGVPRNLALAKTQVWRSQSANAESGARERTQVHVAESVMQHLSAEVWAGQAARGARVMMTTVRRSIVDLQPMPVESRRSEPPACEAAIAACPTPISTEVYDPPKIPRRFQLPNAAGLRIAAIVVCAASIALLAFSTLGNTGSPGTGVVTSAAKKSAAAQPPQNTSAASSLQTAALPREASPAPANSSGGANDLPSASSVSSASQREAVDALIAGKHPLALARYRALARSHPNEPAYAAAARILEEAQQRNAE